MRLRLLATDRCILILPACALAVMTVSSWVEGLRRTAKGGDYKPGEPIDKICTRKAW